MPCAPTSSQSEASRRNGALSCGPLTSRGKAASARNGLRHGLFADKLQLDEEEAAHFSDLLDDLARLHRPVGAVEAHWVRQMAVEMIRAERLNVIELRVEQAALAGLEAVREAGLPSPATVLRYRARLQRDQERAAGELAAARALRAAGSETVAMPAAKQAQPAEVDKAASARADTMLPGLLAALGGNGAVEAEVARARFGKPEPEPAMPAALNRAQRRRMEARQRQAAHA